MKIFLDTNAWVSALMAPGLCEDLLLDGCKQGRVMSSALVWAELAEVLRRKVEASETSVAAARTLWRETIRVAEPVAPADDADARLVAAAAAAGADFFVTGDKRVLKWAAVGTMRIVSPRDLSVMLSGRC